MTEEKLLEEVGSYDDDSSILDERVLTKKESLFSTLLGDDGKVYRFFPENCETYADSFILRMLLYLSTVELKEIPRFTVKGLSVDKFIDQTWSASASFFQGLLKGIVMLKQGKCVLCKKTKSPWKQGLWYVQTRALKKLSYEKTILSIPKQTGLFNYLAQRDKGFVLSEMTVISQLVNSAIDKYSAPIRLIKYVLLSPESLSARGQIRHKKPQDKSVIYFPSEIDYLTKHFTPIFRKEWEDTSNIYNNIEERIDVLKYAQRISLHNSILRSQTKLADKIASSRVGVLFKKGQKGKLEERLENLSLEEYLRFYPNRWGLGITTPPFVNVNNEDSIKYFTHFIIKELKKVEEPLKGFLQDWINNLALVNPKLSAFFYE
jgi:hypothetical protein